MCWKCLLIHRMWTVQLSMLVPEVRRPRLCTIGVELPNALEYCCSRAWRHQTEFLRFLWPLWHWKLCAVAKPTKFRTLKPNIRVPGLLLISCVTLSVLLCLCPSVALCADSGPWHLFLDPFLCRAAVKTFTHLKKNEVGLGQRFSTFTCHAAVEHPWQLVLPVNFTCHSCWLNPS